MSPLTTRRGLPVRPCAAPAEPLGGAGGRARSGATATMAATTTGRARSVVANGRTADASVRPSLSAGAATRVPNRAPNAAKRAATRLLVRLVGDTRRAGRGQNGRPTPSVDLGNTAS